MKFDSERRWQLWGTSSCEESWGGGSRADGGQKEGLAGGRQTPLLRVAVPRGCLWAVAWEGRGPGYAPGSTTLCPSPSWSLLSRKTVTGAEGRELLVVWCQEEGCETWDLLEAQVPRDTPIPQLKCRWPLQVPRDTPVPLFKCRWPSWAPGNSPFPCSNAGDSRGPHVTAPSPNSNAGDPRTMLVWTAQVHLHVDIFQ